MDRFSEIYKEITTELNTCNHEWLDLRDLLNKIDREDEQQIKALNSCLVVCEERFFSAERLYEKINKEGNVIEKNARWFLLTVLRLV